MEMIANIIGLIGVAIILSTYFLLNMNKITSTHMTYLILNLVGSLLILYSLFFAWNLPSVVIEFAWISISLIGIYRAVYIHKK